MMQERQNKFVEFLATRSMRFWLILTGLTLLVVALVTFFVQNALYLIKVDASTGWSMDLTPKKQASIRTVFGVSVVPRDTDQIIVTSTNTAIRQETRYALSEKPLLWPQEITIKLTEQRDVDKVGTNSLGCNFASVSDYFTYACSAPETVFKFRATPRWENSPVLNLPENVFDIENYQQGILVLATPLDIDIEETAPSELLYIQQGQVAKKIGLPANANLKIGDTLSLSTSHTGGAGFVLLNNRTNDLFIYSSLDTQPKVVKFDRAISSAETRLCSVADKVICYTGVSAHDTDSEEEEIALQKVKDGAVTTFSFTGDELSNQRITKSFSVGDICLTKNGALYARHEDSLYILDTSGNRITPKRITRAIESYACGNQFVYTTDQGLFVVEGNNARLLFSSPNHRVSSVESIGDKIILNTFIYSDTTGVAHTYRVNAAAADNNRWEDKLPYTINGDIPLLAMDYGANSIYMQVFASPISNRQTGTYTVDPVEFEAAKTAIRQRLSQDGILTSNPELIFTY